MTLAEAAADLGLSVQTLRVQIGNGRFKARRLGHIWVTDERAVAAYRAESLGKPGTRKRKAS